MRRQLLLFDDLHEWSAPSEGSTTTGTPVLLTTTVTSGLTKLIQYLSLHLLAAVAVTLDRHCGDCLSLFHRQPHLLPPAPLRAAAVSTFSSRFLYEATNTLWSRFSVSQFALLTPDSLKK
jgi:hypothetical protein